MNTLNLAGSAAPTACTKAIDIRAVKGPRSGARHRIECAGTLTISTAYGADIVLRDREHAFFAKLEPAPGAALRLMMEEGEAALLGVPIRDGAVCLWPPFTPLAIGAHLLAHGDADSPRWDELYDMLPGLVLEPAAEDAPPHSDGGALAALVDRLPARYRRLVCGGVTAAALVAAFLATPVPELPRTPASPDAVSRILADEGLAGLEVHHAAGGVVRISGTPASAEALGRVNDRLRRAGVAYRIDLMSEAEMLGAVEDVARLHGIAARARTSGTDGIILDTAPLDSESRAQLASAIRADVPAVQQIWLRDGLSPPDNAAPRSVSEAAKRVATVIRGEPSYVLTADGARYFPGALLPSGHVLEAIEDGAIVVARNGSTTRIRF
ncbi:MAG: hypothetical protein ACK4TG_08730 [Thermaurantiacus sp.]